MVAYCSLPMIQKIPHGATFLFYVSIYLRGMQGAFLPMENYNSKSMTKITDNQQQCFYGCSIFHI